MLNIHSAFQMLALTSSRVASIDDVASTLALVYRDDIDSIPVRELSTTIGRACAWVKSHYVLDVGPAHELRSKLVRMVLRDLQEWGATIIEEHGLRNDDIAFDARMTFAPGHQKIIEDAWDAFPTAPVWVSFERQFTTFRLRNRPSSPPLRFAVGDRVELTRDCELGDEGALAVIVTINTAFMTLRFTSGAEVNTGSDYKFLRKVS